MIHPNIPFLSINAHLHLQVQSIGWCHLQNGCQLHYHMADSVLTSGCSLIREQIWNEFCISLVILGKYIQIDTLSAGKSSMYIHISGWHTVDLGSVSSIIATGRRSGWQSRCFWCRLSELVWCRCTCAYALPACLWILCCTIWARKAAVHLIFMNHSRVSFNRSLHISMPKKLKSPLLLFPDFSLRLFDQVLNFLHCGAQISTFGHFNHIHCKAHGARF